MDKAAEMVYGLCNGDAVVAFKSFAVKIYSWPPRSLALGGPTTKRGRWLVRRGRGFCFPPHEQFFVLELA